MRKRFCRTHYSWRRVAIYEPISITTSSDPASAEQQFLKKCRAGTRVAAECDANGTVVIFIQGNRRIGCLPNDVAAWVLPLLESGRVKFDLELWTLQQHADEGGHSHLAATVAITQFDYVPIHRFSPR